MVAAEDADYFHHGGIDYRGMVRAFIENVLRGRTAQGGSTITQQVVKTFLLTPERTHAAQGAGDHPRAPAVAEAVEGGDPRACT